MKTVLMHDGNHDLVSSPVWSLRITQNLIKAWTTKYIYFDY